MIDRRWFNVFILLFLLTAHSRVCAQPEPISNLTALASSTEGAVDLQWTSPDPCDGSSAPSGYLVKFATGEINSADFYAQWVSTYTQSWTGFASSGTVEAKTLTGLTPGATLYFAVAAKDSSLNYGLWRSSSDTGGAINTANFGVVFDSNPAQVAGVSLVSGDNLIDVSWTANSEIDLKQYSVERSSFSLSEGFGNAAVILKPGTTHQDTGLINGNTYYYRIKAIDNAGNSGQYSSVCASAPWINLGAANFTADCVAVSTTQIKWAWGTSTNADGYRIINSTSGQNISGDLGSGATVWVQASLSPNTSSFVYVQAFNGYLTSDSQPKKLFTLANPPSNITSSALTSQIDLSWSSNNNSPLTRYTVRQSTDDFISDDKLRMNLAVSTTHQDTGLMEGTTYWYKIWSVNNDTVTVSSEYAYYSTCTIRTAPSAPVLGNVLTGTNDGEISIDWVASGDDGTAGQCSLYLVKWATYTITGSNFDSISVSSSITATPGKTYPLSETARIINGLYPGTTYCFAIKALDEVSNYSVISDTKTALSRDNPPQAPTGISALAVSSSTVNLSWTLPSYTGYDDRDKYKIYRATFSFAGFQQNVSTFTVLHNATYFADLGLFAEITYYYRVSCLDKGDEGNGLYSIVLESNLSDPIVSVKTPDTAPPGAITQIAASQGASEGKINLIWESPGDDAYSGQITGGKFRIDWSSDPLKDFQSVNYELEIPTNTYPNENNFVEAGGLTGGTTYYFRVWTADDYNNWSEVSCGATAWAQVDVTKPRSITDLAATALWKSANLSWTSPGDDGGSGVLNGFYEIRASTEQAINDSNWDSVSPGYPYRILWSTTTAPDLLQSKMITGLANGTSYYFAIKSVDENGNWSYLFQSSPVAKPLNHSPSVFGLSLPADGSISSTQLPAFIWNPASDADSIYGDTFSYTIYYSTDSNFTASVTTTSSGISGTSYAPGSPLPEDKTVYWRVAAVDSEGASTLCSNTFEVKINQVNSPPGAFSLISPAVAITTNTASPFLSWTAAIDNDPGDAVTYDVEYSRYENFSVFTSSAGIAGTYYTAPQLDENATYWWKVWAKDAYLRTFCVTTYYFKVNAVPEAPSTFNLSSPGENVVLNTTTVNFAWQAASDPDPGETVKYEISWSQSPSFASSTTISGLSDTTTTYAGFVENEIYYWRVAAVGSDNELRQSNQTWRYYVDAQKELPGPFDLIEPAFGVEISTTLTPLFSWTKADDPDPADEVRYIFDISPNPDFTGLGTMAVDRGADRYYVPLINLTDQTTYYWRVRASGYQGSPIPSQVDPGFTFSLTTGTFVISMINNPPESFSLISPANGGVLNTKKPKFSWNAANDADVGSSVSYAILISTDSNFSVVIESATGITGLEYEPKNSLFENRTYFWKVTACDNKGGNTDCPLNFSFTIPVLNVPQVCAGLRGLLSDDKLQFTVFWDAVSKNSNYTSIDDLAAYRIYRGLSPQKAVLYAVLSSSVTQWCDENTDGGNLYYQVRAVDTSGIESEQQNSPYLSSLFSGTLYMKSATNELELEIPEQVSRILMASNNAYNQNLNFILERNLSDENDVVLSSYRVALLTGEGDPAGNISFPRPVKLKYYYGSGTPIAEKAQSQSISASQLGHMSVFWNNGIEYLKVGGKCDNKEKEVELMIVKTGDYQLRKVMAATSFKIAAINPPKVFTPGIAPYEKIMFYVDNPDGDKVSGKVFDIKGEFAANLNVVGDATATNVILQWDAITTDNASAPKGVYIYQIEGSGRVINGTIIVAR